MSECRFFVILTRPGYLQCCARHKILGMGVKRFWIPRRLVGAHAGKSDRSARQIWIALTLQTFSPPSMVMARIRMRFIFFSPAR